MQICLQKVYFCFGHAFKSACRRFTSVLVKLFLISFLFISFTFVLAVRNKHRIENIKIVHVFVKSGLRAAVGLLSEYYESHFQILVINLHIDNHCSGGSHCGLFLARPSHLSLPKKVLLLLCRGCPRTMFTIQSNYSEYTFNSSQISYLCIDLR
ncbi:unnamed protein product [Camellia sinensis]